MTTKYSFSNYNTLNMVFASQKLALGKPSFCFDTIHMVVMNLNPLPFLTKHFWEMFSRSPSNFLKNNWRKKKCFRYINHSRNLTKASPPFKKFPNIIYLCHWIQGCKYLVPRNQINFLLFSVKFGPQPFNALYDLRSIM